MLYDYSTVTPDSVRRAVDDAIDRCEQLVAELVAADPSWETSMAPLDRINAIGVEAYGVGPFMARVHPDKAVRDAAQEAEEKLSKWQSDLVFRRDLYEAVERYAATDEAASLDGEPARLLEFVKRDLRRAGHELTDTEREEVQQLRTRLVELSVAFARNIDEHEDGIDLGEGDMEGLPPEYVAGLGEGTAPGTKRVTLDYPDYYPFMDFSSQRDLRRELQFKFFNKAVALNEPILEEAVGIRRRIAAIFGHPSWAHYAMELKMAKEPKVVEAFYDGLVPALETKGATELDDLRSAHNTDDLQGWDYRYLHTKIKRERFGVDPAEVAAFFPLQQVLDGMLDITAEVFDLSYERLDVPTWHPDVTALAIRDGSSNALLAHVYLDLHPREGKFGHAAAFDLVPSRLEPDGQVVPVTAIAANFTKPTGDAPSLLKHDEVTTFFHEFGHVLHNSLGHTRLARFSGFNAEWDFVEAPSQIMEHWCWKPDVLRRFARHHESGDPIPDELVEQLVAARDLHIGLFMLRQVSFGMLDLRFHGPGESKDLRAITRETSEISGFPYFDGTFFPASFGHLFGYDAGYYGYLWSKVFGDDMFSRFEQEGVLSPAVGADYRERVLEPGGSKDADQLLRDFLGREPNQDAFLRYLGIEAG